MRKRLASQQLYSGQQLLDDDEDSEGIVPTVHDSNTSHILEMTGIPAVNVEDLITRAVQQAIDRSDENWDKRVEDLLQRADQRAELKIAQSEARLRAEIRDLEAKVSKALSETASVSSSAARGDGDSLGSRSEQNLFQPRKIEIKGWIQNWNLRDSEAMTAAECKIFVETLFTELDEESTNLIDRTATEQVTNRVLWYVVVIHLKPDLTNAQVWGLCKKIQDCLQDDQLRVRGCRVRATVEAPPWRPPLNRAAARAMSIMQEWGIRELKPQWSTGAVQIYTMSLGDRPVQLASYSEKTGWIVQVVQIKRAGLDKPEKEIIEALSSS